MDIVKQLVDILQKGGPWTVTAISLFVSYKLWIRLNEKDEKIFNLLDKQNEIVKLLDRFLDKGGK